VDITSNTNWNVSADQLWLTVSPAAGVETGELVITAGANPTIAERTAVVTVSIFGLAPQQIVVTQEAGDTVLYILEEMISVAAEEGSKATIEVTSNTSWSASTDQNWLTLSPMTGAGNGTITLTAKANPVATDRPAYLIVTDGKAASDTIIVVQLAGHVGATTITKENVMLYPNPVTEGFQIKGLKGRAELTVSDLSGKMIFSKVIDGSEYVSTSLLAKGMYIVRITNDKSSIEKKLIKK
jgi:hypothetical protein